MATLSNEDYRQNVTWEKTGDGECVAIRLVVTANEILIGNRE